MRWDTGIATHACHVMDFALGQALGHWRTFPPEPPPAPVYKKKDRLAKEPEIERLFKHRWDSASGSGDIDRMWAVIQEAANHWQYYIADARPRVRGSPTVRWRTDEPHRAYTGESVSMASRVSRLHLRRLRQAARLHGAGALHAAADVMRAIRSAA